MSAKNKSGKDAFTFSLSGLKTMAAYTAAGAIADDRINKTWDEKFRRAQEEPASAAGQGRPVSGRFWLSRRRRTA